jgi:hypothetical protein
LFVEWNTPEPGTDTKRPASFTAKEEIGNVLVESPGYLGRPLLAEIQLEP